MKVCFFSSPFLLPLSLSHLSLGFLRGFDPSISFYPSSLAIFPPLLFFRTLLHRAGDTASGPTPVCFSVTVINTGQRQLGEEEVYLFILSHHSLSLREV